jgi:O-antigen ligase
LKFINFAYIPVALFTISLTGTRFALIMAVPALFFGVTSLSRVKLALRALIFVLLLGSMLLLSREVPEWSYKRLGTVVDEITTGDLSSRTAFWKEGLETWARSPFVGLGAGVFPRVIESGRDAHNSMIAILVELGVVGLLLFGLVLAVSVSQAWQLPKWEFRFWMTIIVVLFLGNMVLTLENSKRTWFLLSMLAVSARLYRQNQVVGRDSETSEERLDQGGVLGYLPDRA